MATDYALTRFAREARIALGEQLHRPEGEIELAPPKANIPADLAFPTFQIARERGVPPPRLAQELAATVRFGPDSLVGAAVAAGPYLNFSLDPQRFAVEVIAEVIDRGDLYGHGDLGAGRTALVDYSSPNMARRMHVGHIRSTIIGQALGNILAANGYRVVRDNHIGDWGKNFGVLITAIQHEGRPAGMGEDALAALERLYADYNRRTEEEPAIDQEARDWSLRLEQGDPEARDLWEWIVQLTLRVNQSLYDRLGVRFDTVLGESFFSDKMTPVLDLALQTSVAHQNDDGSLVVELPDLPTFLLQRRDSGTLYITRDAATIAYRRHEYDPAAIVYVVDARQELHFRQLFALVRALGIAPGSELVHVPFGMVVGSDGQPLAARRGNMVFLQALLDEAHARARAVVDEASPELADEEKDAIAEAVGVGAVIYNDLYQDPKRNISLDWDRMLSLQGNSAPYIQYMRARCCSILRKAAATPIDQTVDRAPSDPRLLVHPAEVALVKQLARLPRAVEEAGERYAPTVVAEWCYEMARATSIFYRDCPVLTAPTPELREARLQLMVVVAQGIKNGLALLGIKSPERM